MKTRVPIVWAAGEGERRLFLGGGLHTWKLTTDDTDGAFFMFAHPRHCHKFVKVTRAHALGEDIVGKEHKQVTVLTAVEIIEQLSKAPTRIQFQQR